MKISTRKLMALGFSASYIVLMFVCTWLDKSVPSEFVAIVSTVTGYYFGKSTALDQPKGE